MERYCKDNTQWEEQWERTKDWKDKEMEGQWKGDKGMRGQRDKGQRTGGTKDWRDKGLEDNGEWGQRNNGVKGTKDMEQWEQKGIVG